MPPRLKVLMSAYACEPDRGSEPEVGWQWALQMARFHDVTVVTRANNRSLIEPTLANHSGSKPEFIYYDLPAWLLALKRRGLPVVIYYALWQWGVRRHLAVRLRDFDLVHHVTFNSFRQPGFWWSCGKPVVLGPLGGGQICPWRFLLTFGRQMLPEAARSLSVLGSALLPNLYASFSAATVILVANRDTARRVPASFHPKVQSLLETGVPRGLIQPAKPRDDDGTIRIIWISRLEKIKGGLLALRAFALALAKEKKLRLSIVGGGPENAGLRRLAMKLRIDSAITWHGAVAKADIPKLLQAQDLFLFTSLRDTSGNVLLEAMAAGLPALTLLHHGAAEIATDETALRIPPTHPAETAQVIARGILRLADAPDLRERMSRAATARMLTEYAWERKGEQMSGIYEQAMRQFQARA